MAERYKDLSKKSSEIVFLQSQSNFVEKTLGANEKIKIRPECVVAFSPSVNIQRDFGPGMLHMFSSRGKFVTLTGPGLVYIDMQVGNRFFKKDQLSLYVVVLYFMLYFLMFLIVTFDRRLERMMAGVAGNAGE
jgi:Mitochondrial biogenesis AIM24